MEEELKGSLPNEDAAEKVVMEPVAGLEEELVGYCCSPPL